MGAKYEYCTEIVRNQNDLADVMNNKAKAGWRVIEVCPIETRMTWDILITFEREKNI